MSISSSPEVNAALLTDMGGTVNESQRVVLSGV